MNPQRNATYLFTVNRPLFTELADVPVHCERVPFTVNKLLEAVVGPFEIGPDRDRNSAELLQEFIPLCRSGCLGGGVGRLLRLQTGFLCSVESYVIPPQDVERYICNPRSIRPPLTRRASAAQQ